MTIRVEKLLRETRTDLKPPRTLDKAHWPPRYEEVLVWRRAQLARFQLDPKLVEDAKRFYASHALEFINHWCDTHDPRNVGTAKPVWMPFILFKKQEELVAFVLSCLFEEQPGLIEKCRTMGATWVCVCLSVWLWLFHPGVAIGWGSQDAVSVDRLGDPKAIFWKIRELIWRLPDVFKPVGLQNEHLKQFVCYNPQNGSAIVGEVGDKIGRGGRTRIYFKDESAHYEHPETIEASLSENTKVPIDISSVNGLGNLFHRKRESGMDWYPGVQIARGYTRVLVLDWRDHPEYNETWYQEKKDHHERQGTQHVFAQEIERNYSASVQGVIIPAEWVKAAIDAHVVLGFSDDGGWGAGLDVGDSEDGDRNALVKRKGVVLNFAEEWTAPDPGVTARKAIGACSEHSHINLQYDCIGVGASVKAEANRLKGDGFWPKGVQLVPWNAGDRVLHPRQRVVPNDDKSPVNFDFYQNLKAQGWWELRGRFYRTYRAVESKLKGLNENYDTSTLISLDSRLLLLRKIEKELSQPTITKSSKLKLLVDKAPEGTRSPNLADAIMMCYWPLPGSGVLLGLGGKLFVEGEMLIGGKR